MKRIGASRPTSGLLATEGGRTWSLWTLAASTGAGSWTTATQAQSTRTQLSWRNGTTAIGLAMFHLDLSATFDGLAAGHVVHMRAERSNVAGDVQQVGPGTALDPAGYGYAVQISSGTISVVKVEAWGVAVLDTVTHPVAAGDVVSLSYSYDAPKGLVDLVAMVNGFPVVLAVDEGPYLFGGGALPGLYGAATMSVPTSRAIGHCVGEWWLTFGALSFCEPPARPSLLSSLRITAQRRRPWLTTAEPTALRLVSGEILSASWSTKRIGGCATLSAKFRYADGDLDEPTWSAPDVDDWHAGDWISGEVVVEMRHLDLPAQVNQKLDRVWRGRISRIDIDPATREVEIEGEGLVAALDENYLVASYDNWTIRDIVRNIVQRVSQVADQGFGGGSSYLRYNPAKIVGSQSALDARVSIDFDATSAQNALADVVAYLPGGFVWGVDVDGDFYLDQQADHYSPDLVAQEGRELLHFDAASQQVEKFSLTHDLARVVTNYVVFGEELEDAELGPSSRVSTTRRGGFATSTRARQLFGVRSRIETGSYPTDGLCAKVAVAAVRRTLVPAISADLTVVDGVQDVASVQHLIDRAPPRVSVTDRSSAYRLPGGGTSGRVSTEFSLRRWGDFPAYRTNDRGTLGALLTWPSTSTERTLDRSWLWHAVLRFDFALAGGSDVFIAGRGPDPAFPASFGWGFLLWQQSTGKLLWTYTTSGGTNRFVDTGITVSSVGTVVHFTVWRDASGTFRFYNQTTLTGTNATLQADVPHVVDSTWRAFSWGGAQFGPWDGSIEQVWLLSTSELQSNYSGGVASFITVANDAALPRNRAQGLLHYLPANEPVTDASYPVIELTPGTLPMWQSGALVFASWSRATGGGDALAATAGARRGVLLGQPKRWGGPIVLDVESVDYSIDGQTGILRRKFSLGEIPITTTTTLSALEAQVERIRDMRAATSSGSRPSAVSQTNGQTSMPSSSGGGVSDGDKGDIDVSSGGSIWTIGADVLTPAGRAIAAAASAAAQRAVLGLGTAATLNVYGIGDPLGVVTAISSFAWIVHGHVPGDITIDASSILANDLTIPGGGVSFNPTMAVDETPVAGCKLAGWEPSGKLRVFEASLIASAGYPSLLSAASLS